jgi:hypothetical protein
VFGTRPAPACDALDAAGADMFTAAALAPEAAWDYLAYDSAGNLVEAGLLGEAEPFCARLEETDADGLEAVAARCYDPHPGRWLVADAPPA